MDSWEKKIEKINPDFVAKKIFIDWLLKALWLSNLPDLYRHILSFNIFLRIAVKWFHKCKEISTSWTYLSYLFLTWPWKSTNITDKERNKDHSTMIIRIKTSSSAEHKYVWNVSYEAVKTCILSAFKIQCVQLRALCQSKNALYALGTPLLAAGTKVRRNCFLPLYWVDQHFLCIFNRITGWSSQQLVFMIGGVNMIFISQAAKQETLLSLSMATVLHERLHSIFQNKQKLTKP